MDVLAKLSECCASSRRLRKLFILLKILITAILLEYVYGYAMSDKEITERFVNNVCMTNLKISV